MVDEGAIFRDWADRGYFGGVWEDQPERTWADFVHAEDELIMLIEGSVELEIRGDTQQLQPGREVHIPAGTRHTIRTLGGNHARWLYAYARRARKMSYSY